MVCVSNKIIVKKGLLQILHIRISFLTRIKNILQCILELSDTIYFREHLNEKHDLKLSAHNKIYKCTFCDEFFDRKSPLLMHKKAVHPGQTNYMCDDCGKKCHTPSELSIHRRMHTGKHYVFV